MFFHNINNIWDNPNPIDELIYFSRWLLHHQPDYGLIQDDPITPLEGLVSRVQHDGSSFGGFVGGIRQAKCWCYGDSNSSEWVNKPTYRGHHLAVSSFEQYWFGILVVYLKKRREGF
jgi:hypothetical protein